MNVHNSSKNKQQDQTVRRRILFQKGAKNDNIEESILQHTIGANTDEHAVSSVERHTSPFVKAKISQQESSSSIQGEEFVHAKITTGGDQLTRVNLDSAKMLRLGAHNPKERLEQLSPVLEEFFHVQQDLLEKIYKKFYSGETSRVSGSLSNLRAALRRTNVTGAVKATGGYEAHKDFACCIARMMILNLSKELQGDLILPENFKVWHNKKKRAWIESKTEVVVNKLYVPFRAPSTEPIVCNVSFNGVVQQFTFPPDYAGKFVQVRLGNHEVTFEIPTESCEKIEGEHNNLKAYSLAFLRVMIDFMVFDELIKLGDVNRVTCMVKRLIPLFIGLTSYRSKYAIEMVNFLTKTLHMLSEKQSVASRIRSFINTSGKIGKNKPADMAQENNIKKVKSVLKSLGAAKTNSSIIRASLAAPMLVHIDNVLRKNVQLDDSKICFDHYKKACSGDEDVVLQVLRNTKPFANTENCRIPVMMNVSPSVIHGVDKQKVSKFILTNAKRAVTRAEGFIFDEDFD